MENDKQPRILIIDELLSDLDSNINEMQNYVNRLDENNYKCFFIYIYSLFEGAMWQLAKSILYAFPEKLLQKDEQGKKNEKNITLPKSCLNSADILVDIIDDRLKKMGKENLFDYLTEITNILNYKDKDKDSQTKFFKISKMRNAVVHNNSLKKYDRANRSSVPLHNNYTIQEFIFLPS